MIGRKIRFNDPSITPPLTKKKFNAGSGMFGEAKVVFRNKVTGGAPGLLTTMTTTTTTRQHRNAILI